MNKVIVYTNDMGQTSICYPTGEVPIEVVQEKDIPQGIESFIVDLESLPKDHNDFFDALEQTKGVVTINLAKAKAIAHAMRREKRDIEFAPYDDIIMKQIPGLDAATAEASRVVIRDKYTEIQAAIDSATDVDGIKEAMKGFQ